MIRMLVALLLACLCALPGQAVENPNGMIALQALRHSSDWSSRNEAWAPMMLEIERQTSLEGKVDVTPVEPGSPDIFNSPLMVMSGSAAFQPFSEEEVRNLQHFLRGGGLLFIENTQGALGAGFDRSVRDLVARLLPGKPFEKIKSDHVIFQSFFLLDSVPGRLNHKPYLEGVWLDDRTPVLYSQNDIQGAWLRDGFGNWRYAISPGGERQRDYCFRFGINLVMYSMTVNYKKDQVHIPFILQRRR